MIGRHIATSWAALTTPGSVKPLDGLRAVAILLVLATHVLQHLPAIATKLTQPIWLHPLDNGWIGVDLFFVLSGFLIGGALLRSISGGGFSFRRFYLRRFFRILPAYFAVVVVLCLIRLVWPACGRIPPFSPGQLVPNLLLLTDYWQAPIGIPSWSLSIEEHFYLLVPLLLVAARKFTPAARGRLLLSFVFLALLARVLAYLLWDLGHVTSGDDILRQIYYPFHTRMDALAMGVLVAAMHQETGEGVPHSFRAIAGSLGLLLVAYVYVCAGFYGRWVGVTLQYTLLAIGFGAVVWSVLPTQPLTLLARVLSAKGWVPIARLSYSIYLTHLVVFQFVDDPSRTMWLSLLVMVASSLGVALVLYLLIEAPLHRYAQRRFHQAADREPPARIQDGRSRSSG